MTRARYVGPVVVACLTQVPLLNAESGRPQVGSFADTYCVDCHSGADPKGRFRAGEPFDSGSAVDVQEKWKRAADYVTKGVMPPSGARQPTPGERQEFSEAVLVALDPDADSTRSRTTGARRLNRTEYINTLRDLFQIREIRLPATFPDDNPDLRFDTMAEGTHLSTGLLDAYEAIAVDIADRMVPLPNPQQRSSVSNRSSVGVDESRTKFWIREGDESGLYFTGVNIAGWSGGLWDKAFRAHASGTYRVRIKVSAEAGAGADGRPLRLGFYALNTSDYNLPKRALRVDLPKVGEVEVQNREPDVVDVDLPLEQGEGFHVYCENRLSKNYPSALIRTPGNTQDLRRLLATYLTESQQSPEPTIRFEHMEIKGPVAPLPRQLEFLGKVSPGLDAPYLESVLLPLAERAFRRPLTEHERTALVESAAEHGASAPDPAYALHYGVRQILLSPQFLFRAMGSVRLDDFDLASRLSYFLWSTMPDSELIGLARHGRLADPATMDEQVRRMVRDPRARQFVQHFAGQWLGGREAATVMVCDVRHVWSELIRHGIVRSTEMFFEEILQENLSIRNFIDSGFTYANEPMKIAWGVPGSEVSLHRLEADQRQSLLWPEPKRITFSSLGPEIPPHVADRGGVLGLSSVYAATGDGVESSPILRGVWVLENLLGTPLPPPPSDVPALDVDISLATTVKEVIAAHQKVEKCALCHSKIDPIGLALENYDAVGGWRESYYQDESVDRAASPVETDSQMPDGARLGGAQGLKDYLAKRPAMFTRALAGLLLKYATGREPNSNDRRVLEIVVAEEPEEGYGFLDLVSKLVSSPAFARK